MSELLAVVRFDVSIAFDEVCAVVVLNKNSVHVPGYIVVCVANNLCSSLLVKVCTIVASSCVKYDCKTFGQESDSVCWFPVNSSS